MAIIFAQSATQFKLKNKSVLKKWIKQVIENENLKQGNLLYHFCSDDELLTINKQFLDHDTYTDIITFDYREDNQINGEIHISFDRIKENAIKFNVSEDYELHRVMIHGVLHICGYKDKSKSQKLQMRKKEDEALELLAKLF